MKPPKCRTCGKEEWQHTCGERERFVATPPPGTRLVVTKPGSVTKPSASKGGRPKAHASGADRQKAYRARKATKA